MEGDSQQGKAVPVKVIVRCRPLDAKETREGGSKVISCSEDSVDMAFSAGKKQLYKNFKFDHVYGPEVAQESLFQDTIVPVLEEVMCGFNCTVFAYGQTGTGKTFTMEGDRDVNNTNAGVIPRAISFIFKKLESDCVEYSVRVSYLEMYNEELLDLLAMEKVNLRLFEDRRGVFVQNLEEIPVSNAQEIYSILDNAREKRHTAETQMNMNSSRSHCVFSITIRMKESTPAGEDLIKVGKLNLVDLAGSENIGRSGAVTQRAKEAGLINQSLLTLGRVITSLVEHAPHVPYRESKLTRLLQDSLGGKTKTCIIATISPSSTSVEETLSTLDYASRAKQIKNKPEVNQKMTKRALIMEYVKEIEHLRAELVAAREKNGVYLPSDRFAEMQATMEASETAIKSLEAQLVQKETEFQETSKLLKLTTSELEEVKDQFTQTQQELAKTQESLAKTKTALKETTMQLRETEEVVRVQSANEEVLHGKATVLLTQLKDTLADVDGLHAKVERKTNVASTNSQQTELFGGNMQRQMEKFRQELQSFGDAQSLKWSDNQGHLQSLAASLQESKSNFAASMASSVQSLNDSFMNVQHCLQSFGKSTSLDLAQNISDSAAFIDRMAPVLEDAMSQMTTQLAAMQKLQEIQAEKQNTTLKFFESQMTQMMENSQGFFESSLEQCDKTLDAIATAEQEHLDIQNDYASQMQELDEKLQFESTEAYDWIMAHMDEYVRDKLWMVDSNMRKTRTLMQAKMQARMDSQHCRLQNVVASTKGIMTFTKEGQEQSVRAEQSVAKAASDHEAMWQQSTKENQTAVSNLGTFLRAQGDEVSLELHAESERLLSSEEEQVSKHNVRMDELLTGLDRERQGLLQVLSDKVEAPMQFQIQHWEVQSTDFATAMGTNGQAAQTSLQSLQEGAASITHHTHLYIDSLVEDVRTGLTPQKKEVFVNEDLPLAAPATQVKAAFRSKNVNVLSSPRTPSAKLSQFSPSQMNMLSGAFDKENVEMAN
jgi:kinesin family member 11